jgi:peptidoglycan/LPS O-acetylase OafA/YrhL
MQIEGLRGIAIIVVVLFHFTLRFQEIFSGLASGLASGLGNNIFLFIAAYFSYSTKEIKTVKAAVTKLRSKAERLWPTYAICMTLTFVILKLIPLPNKVHLTIIDYTLNLFWVNGFIGTEYVDGAHWFLYAIISLTLISTLIRYIKLQDKWYIYCLWMLGNLGARYLKLPILDVLSGGRYVGVMVLGISLHRLKNKLDEGYSFCDVRALSGIYVSIIFALVYRFISGMAEGIITIIAAALCLLAITGKLKVLCEKPFQSIGTVSYCMFLCHQYIGYEIEYWLMKYFGRFEYWFALPAALAVVIHNCIEKPIAKISSRHRGRFGR